ncbi:MAG: Rubrerythrin, partial [Verrucomicrobia bacterium]|nr:Rubrerythrin [Verrucomicrobiota bacterium]
MNFADLSEQQILALAISAEEEDGRIYADFAEALRGEFPATAELFDAMAREESGHRHRLIDLYRSRFGEHIPLIRRADVRGFYTRRSRLFGVGIRPERARAEAAQMEIQSRNFYQNAAQRVRDASIRQLLGDLAAEESRHESLAEGINARQAEEGQIAQEHDSARRSFVLRIVQPGLAGLMDGSVSTLAPLFAAAFATGNTSETFRIGLAASVGAGISMGFAEALSDDGKISGRGGPLLRGTVCGLMTTGGGIGHTLPYLIHDFHLATGIAVGVVLVELAVISWIRWRYME